VNKKAAKKLLSLARAGETPGRKRAKVFCFFFSKKQRLLCCPAANIDGAGPTAVRRAG
jgi:hypothetical protein